SRLRGACVRTTRSGRGLPGRDERLRASRRRGELMSLNEQQRTYARRSPLPSSVIAKNLGVNVELVDAARGAGMLAPTLTVGDLKRLLEHQPDWRPVIIGHDEWYLNLHALTLDDEQTAIVMEARDDFDTRQW